MEKQIRWGVLSTANIARKAMIPALKESPLAKVIAVSSRAAETAQSCADELAIPKAYASYEDLLADPEIDAVYNPLPNHLHKEWTIHAADAGKHILCEKPLALNVEESEEMLAAARANNVQLMEAFMYRYQPRILAAREMLQNGMIGEVKTIESAFSFNLDDIENIRYQPEMGGGALMDIGCYCINISRLMAGRDPVVVQARAHWAATGVDDQLTGILDFGEGLVAHFVCSFTQQHRQYCLIGGSDGFLALPTAFNPMAFNLGLTETIIRIEKGVEPPEVCTFPAVNNYRLLAEDFMHSILGDPPAFPIEDALSNMRVIQALLASARQNGHPVAP